MRRHQSAGGTYRPRHLTVRQLPWRRRPSAPTSAPTSALGGAWTDPTAPSAIAGLARLGWLGRERPAAPAAPSTGSEPAGTTAEPDPGRQPVGERLEQLGRALAQVRRRQLLDVRQVLLVGGSLAMGLGVVAIVLGWYGASHSAYLFEEIPYLISGGLLGVALVAGGGFLFFGAWLVRLFEQQRRFAGRVERTLDQVDRALEALAADVERRSAPGYRYDEPVGVGADPGPGARP
jgi:hypothetical protein